MVVIRSVGVIERASAAARSGQRAFVGFEACPRLGLADELAQLGEENGARGMSPVECLDPV